MEVTTTWGDKEVDGLLDYRKETTAGCIRALRARDGMSRKELADAAGIPEGTLRTYEEGESKLPLDAAVRMANVFDVPLERLVKLVD